jgi:mannose-6-phosphate isomerase-like protein (cupin superfamily)
MPEIIRVEKLKKKIPKTHFKMPIALVDNYYLGLARFKKKFQLHNHNKDELIYVLDGKLIIKVNNRTFTLHPGEAILIKKGEKHFSLNEEEVHVLIFETQGIKINFLED